MFQDYQKDCASHFDYVIHPAIICEAFGFEIDGLSTFKWFENKGYNINELIAEYHNDRVQFFSTDPYPGSNDPNAENIPFPNIDLALLANKNRLLSEYPEYPEFKSLIAELEHDYPVFDADFQFISD